MARKQPATAASRGHQPPARRTVRDGAEDGSRVVIRFQDNVRLRDGKQTKLSLPPGWAAIWQRLGIPRANVPVPWPAFAVSPGRIQELLARATALDPEYQPPNFANYLEVECPPELAPDHVVRALQDWAVVQTAYVDAATADPTVYPDDDLPGFPLQVYLDPAPDGIDAEYVWPRAGGTGVPGGDGAGVRIIVMERGFTLNHDDLIAHNASVLNQAEGGLILDSSRRHGTADLSIICSVDNGVGCIGIAPWLDKVDVVSCYGATRKNAMLSAIGALRFGDVLVLEAMLAPSGLPIECNDAEFEVIRLATALGIVVIEAAGNGITDLDTVMVGGRQVMNRQVRDSGAILVAGATSSVPHTRWEIVIGGETLGTNFGSRVDCYAWGENVCASASDANGSTTGTDILTNFNGSSAATAIVAGAAAVVQGMALAGGDGPLSPRQVRAILSDPNTGTLSGNPPFDRIGVMPNLRAIAAGSILNLTPDIYLRDFVGDTGDPHTGALSMSPDVILLQQPLANPQGALGDGSGTENQMQGGFALAGQDNYLYIRMRNRGGAAAANVTATVYWSPVATLITPELWTPVGSVTVPNVPTGNVLTVSPALVWPAAAIPATGHYCFVALLSHAMDPAPELPSLLDWDRFWRLVRDNNGITWCNFNVVSNVPPGPGLKEFVRLPFIAVGAPDRARQMYLDVIARLPPQAEVMLEMPLHVRYGLGLSPREFGPADRRSPLVRGRVRATGTSSLGPMLFPAGSRQQLALLVRIPPALRDKPYDIAVRQRIGNDELGRVTWRLAPPR